MIINYTFNNFRSFYNDAEFSMTANTGKVLKRYPDNYSVVPGGLKLLKSAVMVGENAGGKSNFIYSLQFLKSLFQDNSMVKTVSSNINNNAGKDQESFDITFCVESGRVYHYCLTIDSRRIVTESLFFKDESNKRKQSVFKAYWDSETESYFFEDNGLEEPVRNALKKNAGALGLFTTKLALLGNEYAIEAVNWMNNTLYPVSLTEGSLSAKQPSAFHSPFIPLPFFINTRVINVCIMSQPILNHNLHFFSSFFPLYKKEKSQVFPIFLQKKSGHQP